MTYIGDVYRLMVREELTPRAKFELRRFVLAAMGLLIAGCGHVDRLTGSDSHSAPEAHIQTFQNICCNPATTGNEGKCAVVLAQADHTATINGVIVFGLVNSAACINLNEAPFQGRT
jgi:hypothetical protein